MAIKKKDDGIWSVFSETHQRLHLHPLEVQNKLAKCTTTKRSKVSVTEDTYKLYVKPDGTLSFKGNDLKKGMF